MSTVSFTTIPQMLKINASRYSSKIAISCKKAEGKWISISYSGLYERVLMAARGLCKLGLKSGDRVAILSENRAEWAISDLATQVARGVTVPIYATNTAEQVAYVLNHSKAKFVFISTRDQYAKLLGIRDQIPHVSSVFSFDCFLADEQMPVLTLKQLSETSCPLTAEEISTLEAGIDDVKPEDLITIIYTSGTTGVPKGVMLTQANMVSNALRGKEALDDVNGDETFLSFLPLSHVLERTAGYHVALSNGCHIAFAENVQKVLDNLLEIRPTTMVSVPRLFEKIQSRIYENVNEMSQSKRKLFHKAVAIGQAYVHRRYIQRRPAGLLGMRYRLYDWLVFRKVRDRLGGKLKFCVSGGAPLDKRINEFMWVIGIPTFEGYGLTETSPALTLSNMEGMRFGSVGKALAETDLKIADDGELLVRGPQVMESYYLDPVATENTFEDGWLKTGDIARIDDDGYLYIVDRKKEIIVTAGGKNIAPQPIEKELELDELISHAIVFGDRRPFLVALITPDFDRLINWANENKIHFVDNDDLVSRDKVQQLFEDRVAKANKMFPRYETIKKVVVLARDFSIEGGELTPTLKLKRSVIFKKYVDKIENMYDGAVKPSGARADMRQAGGAI